MNERLINWILAAIAALGSVGAAYCGDLVLAIGLAGSCLFLANRE